MLLASQFISLISTFLYVNYHSILTIKKFVFILIFEKQRETKTLMEKVFSLKIEYTEAHQHVTNTPE